MKKIIAICTMIVLLGGSVFAADFNLVGANKSGLEVISDKLGGEGNLSLKMNCSMDKLHYYDAETPKGKFTVLYTPEMYFGGNYGAPQLPVITKLIQVPFGAEVGIKVHNYEENEYDLAQKGINAPVFPRQPSAPKDGTKVPFVYEKSAYVTKGFNGQQLTTIKEIGVMRHMRLFHITISPIKYNAMDNKIMVYNNIDFEVTMKGADMKATKAEYNAFWTPAFDFMSKKVTVPSALKFAKNNVVQSYVIISDPAFKDAMAPFVAWKTQKGYKVDFVTTDKFGTGAAIRTGAQKYIHNLYNNATAENPAPSYVLFVGDHQQIPAFDGQSKRHITDLYYVAVTKGDNLPDILTGRFSAQTVDQLIPQIERTIEYEKFLFPDPSFLDDVVLTAGWDGSWAKSHGWPHINYAKTNYINQDNGFDTISTFLSAGSHQNEAKIIDAISKGACYVNYTAHGSSTSWADPRLTISNIKALGNKSKYPLIIGNCCLTSKFEVGECFAEAWLRHKDTGAIAYIGGTNSTYWDEDIWWGVGLHSIVKPNNQGVPPLKKDTGVGAFDAMFDTGVTNAGFMLTGNLAVEASNSTRKLYYWEVYQLMGDPSLTTFMRQPKAMRVFHNSKIDLRTTSIKVHAPVGAYVGISHNNELLGAGLVCTDGSVAINLSSVPTSGIVDVVVTAANAKPYMGTMKITQ